MTNYEFLTTSGQEIMARFLADVYISRTFELKTESEAEAVMNEAYNFFIKYLSEQRPDYYGVVG